jgi:hypothetical protein
MIMKTFNKAAIALLLVCLGFFWESCKKDDANPGPSPGPASDQTTISGIVRDPAGNPIEGVSIGVSGKTAISSADGIFSIAGVSPASGRVIVKGSKTGFFDGVKGLIPSVNGISKMELILVPSTKDYDGNSAQNGNFQVNSSGVEIPANSLSGTGAYQVAIEHISPDDADFVRKIPGGDLMATDASGNDRQLYSYGMLMVKITDASGTEINLASGKTATIRMKIADAQLTTAPNSIPLWHFDEVTGKWKEEGMATKQGDQYVGTVSHFSSWNCDIPGERATIKGIVKDCKGKPVEGVRVRIGQTSDFTDASGSYEVFVPSGVAFDVSVDAPELGLSSNPVAVNPVAAGSTQTIPDINVNCLSALSFQLNCSTGTLIHTYYNIKWGNNQSVFGSISGQGIKYIPVPSNGQSATYTFTNALNGKSISGSLTFPSQLDTLNKGSLNLCGDSIASDSLQVSMVINGDGFVNQQISWSGIPLTSFLIYSPSDTSSALISGGTNGFGLSVFFPGLPGPGQFTLEDGAQIGLSAPGGKTYASDSLLVLNVSQFGGVGEKVAGTFSGRFIRVEYDTANQQITTFPITISSGSFEVIRRPDQ